MEELISGEKNGFSFRLALADRPCHRCARLRYRQAEEYGQGSWRRHQGFKEGMREADDKPADQTAAKEIPQQQTAEAKQADTIDVDAKEKPKA